MTTAHHRWCLLQANRKVSSEILKLAGRLGLNSTAAAEWGARVLTTAGSESPTQVLRTAWHMILGHQLKSPDSVKPALTLNEIQGLASGAIPARVRRPAGQTPQSANSAQHIQKYPTRPDPWDARRAPQPDKLVYDINTGLFSAYWGQPIHPKKIPNIRFTKPDHDGMVEVLSIHRSALSNINLPAGSSGQMLAAALRAAKILEPKFIRITNIINGPTVEALQKGIPISSTVLGETLSAAAGELGGATRLWRTGRAPDEKNPWIEAEIGYPKSITPTIKQPLLIK